MPGSMSGQDRPALSCKILTGVIFCYIINPLLTKLVCSRWLDIGVVLHFFFFCVFMDLDENEKKKELQLVNIQPS